MTQDINGECIIFFKVFFFPNKIKSQVLEKALPLICYVSLKHLVLHFVFSRLKVILYGPAYMRTK